MNQKIFSLLAASLFAGFAVLPQAFAVNLQVTADAASCSDCDPTSDCSGNCGDPGTQCPFQEALNIAQCNGVDDVITLAAGSYFSNNVSSADTNCDEDGFCYDGDVNSENSSLTITGAGKGQTFIDGQGASGVIGLTVSPFGTDDSGLQLVIQDITFQNNGPSSGVASGGLIVVAAQSNVLIEDNEFINNGGEQAGGGAQLFLADTGTMTLNRNAFFDNQALSGVPSGGVDFEAGGFGTLVFTNNILAGNIAENNTGGGATFSSFNEVTMYIVNNTFYNNSAAFAGGLNVQLCEDAQVEIYNNIVYLNVAPQGGADIAATSAGKCNQTGTLNLFNNDFIEFLDNTFGLTVAQGDNLNIDPEWVDPDADDLHLTAGSPVIDMGLLDPPGGLPTPDFDGVTRPQGPLPDMGALEFFEAPPSPTPTPTATPLPPPSNLLLFGGGCSLGSGTEAFRFVQFLLALPIAFGVRRYFRRD